MLAKQFRLRKRKAFAYIYKNGQRISTPSLTLVYTPNNARFKKIGFVVSKKIGKAHTRNLVKRRLRSATRQIIGTIPDTYNYVFVARESILELNFEEIKDVIKYLVQKVTKNAGKIS